MEMESSQLEEGIPADSADIQVQGDPIETRDDIHHIVQKLLAEMQSLYQRTDDYIVQQLDARQKYTDSWLAAFVTMYFKLSLKLAKDLKPHLLRVERQYDWDQVKSSLDAASTALKNLRVGTATDADSLRLTDQLKTQLDHILEPLRDSLTNIQ